MEPVTLDLLSQDLTSKPQLRLTRQMFMFLNIIFTSSIFTITLYPHPGELLGKVEQDCTEADLFLLALGGPFG